MSGGDRLIGELDLLAYADGLLDADPQRKAEVETYLHEHPAEALRIRAYMDQNAQIRAHFGPVLDEPIPPRLTRVLEPRPVVPGGRRFARFGMAASLVLAVGGLGWWLGATLHRSPAQVEGFLHQVVSGYRLGEESDYPGSARVKTGALDWFSDRIELGLRPPDLSKQGYILVDRRLVIEGGRRAVQLIYKDRQGRRISLFLRLRWKEDKTPEVRIVENGGVRVAYWLDGPLIYGLVGHLKRDQLMALAKAARRSPQFIRDTLSTHVNSRALPGVEPDIIRQD